MRLPTLLLLMLLSLPLPGLAGPTPPVPTPTAVPRLASGIVAERITWQGFKDYWRKQLGTLGGVVGVTSLVILFAIFIITRGKWK